MLSRAKRQFNLDDFSEGETTDQSTLTNVSRLSCPRILNTLQVQHSILSILGTYTGLTLIFTT